MTKATHINMHAADEYQSETGQRDLAAGVLKQVTQDLRRFRDATSAIERELYLDAYLWLTTDDFSWPFSFLNVCQSLNLAPETVREDLLGDASLGTFGHWSRRSKRAAQRLQAFLSHVFTNERNGSAAEPATVADAAP
jgi:hypothetical protein